MSRAVWLVLFALPASAADYGSPVPPGPPVDIPLPAAARRPCDAQAAAMQPAPKTTGVPELDDLLREAKRTGNTVARPFNEDGVGLTWFQATPDGWLSRLREPPIPASPPVQAPPRREVAAPVAPFPGTADGWFPEDHSCPRCHHVSAPGTGNWIIRGWNRDGSHEHWCERCGYRGRHRN